MNSGLSPKAYRSSQRFQDFAHIEKAGDQVAEDLRARLKKDNAGCVPYTPKFRPWKLNTAVAFRDHDRATAFERYLKSTSGRAFARKRL